MKHTSWDSLQTQELDAWVAGSGNRMESAVSDGGHKVFHFGVNENVLELTVVLVAHLCEEINYHEAVYFKWMNSVL